MESGTEVRRFPSFPRTEKGRECGNERERNSIAGGDDRRRIVVHENIARLTVNDFAWSSGSLVVDDFNRRPSTGKKAHRKGIPKGGSAPIFPFFDTEVGRPSRVEGNMTYCTN